MLEQARPRGEPETDWHAIAAPPLFLSSPQVGLESPVVSSARRPDWNTRRVPVRWRCVHRGTEEVLEGFHEVSKEYIRLCSEPGGVLKMKGMHRYEHGFDGGGVCRGSG